MSEIILMQNLINESIPNTNAESFQKNNEDESNIDLFVNNLYEKSGLTPIELYPKIIMAYLNNEFELTFVDTIGNNIHIKKSTSKHILVEPDIMFRMINYIYYCTNLTDCLLGYPSRLEGLKMLFNLFKERKLFSYLNYIEVDTYQTLFLIKALRLHIIGHNKSDFFELTGDFPSSIVSKMINEIYNNQNLLQNDGLLDFKYSSDNQIQVQMKPRLISFLID